MKEILKNKRLVAAVAVVLVAVLSVVIAVSVKGNKVETAPENSQPNTSDVSNSETETEKETEKESTEKDAEKVTESTTKKATETTTSNNKPSSSKKPSTTKKPAENKAPTTTKKPSSNKTPSTTAKNNMGMSDEEYQAWQNDIRDAKYAQYGGEAGYKAHLEEIKNEKCPFCGKVGCPSQKYEKNALGDIDGILYETWKCPEVVAGRAKCKHCGKTIVAGPDSSEKVERYPEKYCKGNCYYSF